jgi:hypothetical protein
MGWSKLCTALEVSALHITVEFDSFWTLSAHFRSLSCVPNLIYLDFSQDLHSFVASGSQEQTSLSLSATHGQNWQG